MKTTFSVPPLGVPDAEPAATLEQVLEGPAVQLLVEPAREVRADFAPTQMDATALLDVCRRLDRIPRREQLVDCADCLCGGIN